MKTKWLLVLLVVFLLASSATAQVRTYARADIGAYLQNGRTTVLAGWVGFESPIVTTFDQAFTFSIRLGAFYVDLDHDLQGASVFFVGQKFIACDYMPSFYVAGGGGLIYEIREGYDSQDAALKLEIGCDIYRGFGVSIGTDYIPDPLTDDKFFVYGGLDLSPLICP